MTRKARYCWRRVGTRWSLLLLSTAIITWSPVPLTGVRPTHAQTPFQVRDIGQGPVGSVLSTVAAGDYVYFTTVAGGVELWRTDGTTGGTTLLKSFLPDPGGPYVDLVAVGNRVFFHGWEPATGYELWKSDGTPASTTLVKDIEPGPGSSVPFLSDPGVDLNGVLIFSACTTASGCELWKSDGTTIGTALLKDIVPGSGDAALSNADYTRVGGSVFFAVGGALWSTDGTTANTVVVHPSCLPVGLTEMNGSLYFFGTSNLPTAGLWRSDGTEATTTLVRGFDWIYDIARAGGTLYVNASETGLGEELWKSNGTAAGTVLVRDLVPGAASSYPRFIANLSGTVFFFGNTETGGYGLWKSNGSASNTVLLKTFDTPTATYLYVNAPTAVAAGGTLYFQADDGGGAGLELWKSSGTAAGTIPVKDIQPGTGGSQPGHLVALGSTVYFSADDGVAGRELWRSSGSANGTTMVKDATVGSSDGFPSELTSVGGRLFFSADDGGGTGRELWSTDGSPAGTASVADIEPGPYGSEPRDLINVTGRLFFTACTSDGREVWVNDPVGGPQMVANLSPSTYCSFNDDYDPKELTAIGSRLFLTSDDGGGAGGVGRQLWKIEGSVPVATMLTAPPTYYPRELTPLGSVLYFAATDPATGIELWTSDGTTAAPLDVVPGSDGIVPHELATAGGVLYFAATDGSGTELWKSGGTVGTTVRVMDIAPGAASSSPFALTDVGGTLYFFANATQTTVELWKSNGTAATTTLVRQLDRSFLSYPFAPSPLVAVGGIGFFAGYDAAGGRELWKTDGTFGGTSRVKDINPGAGHSNPTDLLNVGGTLYFAASDGYGIDLWKSNGTSGGTVIVKEFVPRSAYIGPYEMTNANGVIYFGASDGPAGFELWAFCPGSGDYDADGVGDSADNCCTVANPDQRDSDLSGAGDLCDVCPASATDACDPSQSAVALMPPAGGVTLITPDESVTVLVPAGAAPPGTSLSITGGLAGSSFGIGTSSAAVTTELQPGLVCAGGTTPGRACLTAADCGGGATCQDFTFSAPVTVTFGWPDEEASGSQGFCTPGTPGNGTVDATTIDERNLKLFRNGVNFYPAQATRCQDVSECDRCANTWTISTTQFSEWTLGRDCDPTTTAQLKVTKVLEPVGDDGLKIKATFLPPDGGSPIVLDPSVYGLDILLDDETGTVLHAALPAQPYDPVSKTGWKVKFGGKATFKYSNKAANAPGAIQKVVLKVGVPTEPAKIIIKGKNGGFPVSTAVRASISFPGLYELGYGATCVEATFPGPPPLPACGLNGSTLVCK